MERIDKVMKDAAAADASGNRLSPIVDSSNSAQMDRAALLFMATAREVCPDFAVRPELQPVIRALFHWCLQLPGKLDPTKGLWLWGDIGTGKTTMLKIIRAYCRKVRPRDEEGKPYGFSIVNAIEACAAYQEEGYVGLWEFVENPALAIDEIGSETAPTGYFGTTENVLQYILQRRYDKRHDQITHVTTNLSVDQIAKAYGARIYDRCKEMFNFVPMRGRTFRK